ncbi:MAG: hypothetical protein HYS17_06940 [Micavibrio aeruginosavorus]|uniref:Uncharacterized protein n=1 Tax=Micavibrio aeruginosavorus TaxID=349221 RepID=A0A7T5UGF7_9BACT|nr:MAG: hypothetical protein HYS17_06940 [Micavibrio aeruginosavorus]
MTIKDDVLKDVPQALVDRHVPAIKALCGKYAEAVNIITMAYEKDPLNYENDPDVVAFRDEYNALSRKTHQDFIQDGGTDEQWNILSPAVHYGHFGP